MNKDGIFEWNSNQPLTPGSIPDSVHILTFGENFNQPSFGTAGSIPDSVHTLTFGNDFNRALTAGSIPDSVININLYCINHFFRYVIM